MGQLFDLTRAEWTFAVVISSVHGIQHLFNRLLPAIIPILVVALEIPLWQLGLLVSVYMFVGGIAQAPLGVISDRIDRKYLLVPSVVLLALGYLIFALASSVGAHLPTLELVGHRFSGAFQIMVVGTAISGLGFSGIHPTGYPLISVNISTANKGQVLGLWASAAKVGDTVGPVLVGVGILVFTWEWVLAVISGIGFAYAGALGVILRRGSFETRPPALEGAEATDGDVLGELIAHPQLVLLPLVVIVLFFFFIMFAGNGVLTFTPVFVSDVYGYSFDLAGVSVESESVANFYFGALLISGGIAQLFVGGIADAYDHRAVLITLVGIATVTLAILSTVTLGPVALLIVFLVLGGCIFGLYPARDALISDIAPDAYEGRVFGYVFTVVMVGGSAFPVIIGYLADLIGIQASFAFLALGAGVSLACLTLLYSPRVYRQRKTAVAAQ